MYRCSIGDHVVEAKTPANLVVTEIRKRTYLLDNGTTSTGWENVVEEILCPEHAAEATASVEKGKSDESRRKISARV